MTRSQTEKRIAELRKDIRRHDQLCYVEARPEISDRDYDRRQRVMTASVVANNSAWVHEAMPDMSKRFGASPDTMIQHAA